MVQLNFFSVAFHPISCFIIRTLASHYSLCFFVCVFPHPPSTADSNDWYWSDRGHSAGLISISIESFPINLRLFEIGEWKILSVNRIGNILLFVSINLFITTAGAPIIVVPNCRVAGNILFCIGLEQVEWLNGMSGNAWASPFFFLFRQNYN